VRRKATNTGHGAIIPVCNDHTFYQEYRCDCKIRSIRIRWTRPSQLELDRNLWPVLRFPPTGFLRCFPDWNKKVVGFASARVWAAPRKEDVRAWDIMQRKKLSDVFARDFASVTRKIIHFIMHCCRICTGLMRERLVVFDWPSWTHLWTRGNLLVFICPSRPLIQLYCNTTAVWHVMLQVGRPCFLFQWRQLAASWSLKFASCRGNWGAHAKKRPKLISQ